MRKSITTPLIFYNNLLLILVNGTLQISETPVLLDTTIRPTGFEGFCVYKRWADYVQSQDVWSWPCNDATHQNLNKAGKYHWNYNSTTGLVKSIGSERLRPHKPFCWFISRPDTVWSQRLKIKACDENDLQQQFDYEPANGRLVLRSNRRLCVNYQINNDDGVVEKVALTVSKCYGTSFLNFVESSNFEVTSEMNPTETTSISTTTTSTTTTETVIYNDCGGLKFINNTAICCFDDHGKSYLVDFNDSCDVEFTTTTTVQTTTEFSTTENVISTQADDQKICNGQHFDPETNFCCFDGRDYEIKTIGDYCYSHEGWQPAVANEVLAQIIINEQIGRENLRRANAPRTETITKDIEAKIIQLAFHLNQGKSDGCLDFNDTFNDEVSDAFVEDVAFNDDNQF